MKNQLVSAVAACMLIVTSCGDQKAEMKSYNKGINIIPTPNSLVQQDGHYTFNNKTTWYASTADAKTVGEFVASQMRQSTGLPLEFTDNKENARVRLVLNPTLETHDEGYEFTSGTDGVTIQAKTPHGIFYGLQTLKQLLPAEIESKTIVNGINWTIPAVEIRDEPRLNYRGIMLDPCRHFMTVAEVKRQLDVLSLFKINRMHWHLTDDQGFRIEIKKYPKLTEIGGTRIDGDGSVHSGFYTQEEIKEVVQYAADRFITVIPEIEIPGHEMAAIAAYPELSCTGEQYTPRIIWGVEDIVLCAGKEETFEFFEDVMAEVAALFPTEYFHIGGDECPKDEWKKCPLCQARIRQEGIRADKEHTAEEKLQSYFVQRIEKMLAKYGKKIIGWDEILEGGLAPTATVMSWRGEEGGITSAGMGHDVIMTPHSNGMYLDQYEGDYKIEPVTIGGYTTLEKVYNYNPVPQVLVETGKDHHVLGVQCNMWAEYMYTNDLREYRIYPRILALAEIGWTELSNKNYNDFIRRIDNGCVRLEGHHVNYYIPQPEQPYGSCNFVAFIDKATIEFTTSRPMRMVYTTDGSEPSASSASYISPLEFTESTTLKIRTVSASGRMTPTRVITVEKQTPAPAKTVEKINPGLKMDYTYGTYLTTDDLSKATEWNSAIITELRKLTSVEKSYESMRGVKQYSAIASGYVEIPEDGVYYISSDNEEVWMDGKMLISNRGETKRFSRNDTSVALAKGLHEFKVVFLGNMIGGWPSNWNDGSVKLRKEGTEKFIPITPHMLFH